MAGRPRKPVEIKRLQSTLRRHREPKYLVPRIAGEPLPPVWLSKRAAEIFLEHRAFCVAANVDSAIDVTMLALLAVTVEEIEHTSALIEDGGRIVRRTGTRGVQIEVVNPAIGQRSDAVRRAQALLHEFGLSPAARSNVGANAKANEPNPFEDF